MLRASTACMKLVIVYIEAEIASTLTNVLRQLEHIDKWKSASGYAVNI